MELNEIKILVYNVSIIDNQGNKVDFYTTEGGIRDLFSNENFSGEVMDAKSLETFSVKNKVFQNLKIDL